MRESTSGVEARGVVRLPNGKVVIAGTYGQASGDVGILIQLTPTGAPDNTFAAGGAAAVNLGDLAVRRRARPPGRRPPHRRGARRLPHVRRALPAPRNARHHVRARRHPEDTVGIPERGHGRERWWGTRSWWRATSSRAGIASPSSGCSPRSRTGIRSRGRRLGAGTDRATEG